LTLTRTTRKFLEPLVGEDKLTNLLAKVCWYVGVRIHFNICFINILFLLDSSLHLIKSCIHFGQFIDAALDCFNFIAAKDNLTFTIGGFDGSSTLSIYLEQ
jgi:hypothetical protein